MAVISAGATPDVHGGLGEPSLGALPASAPTSHVRVGE